MAVEGPLELHDPAALKEIGDAIEQCRNFNVSHSDIVQDQSSSRAPSSMLYSPFAFFECPRGPLAQLAEQLTLNQ